MRATDWSPMMTGMEPYYAQERAACEWQSEPRPEVSKSQLTKAGAEKS
jgi:hypothetical protein